MMSLETRINGEPIAFAKIRNSLIPVSELGAEFYLYEVEYHRVSKDPSVIKYHVIHNRLASAEVLAGLVYEGLETELKKLEKD